LSFEIIVPDSGVRLLLQAEDEYVWQQWVECVKTEVQAVISDAEDSLLRGAFSITVAPEELSQPWLQAQTPDPTTIRAVRRRCSLSLGVGVYRYNLISDQLRGAQRYGGSSDDEHDDDTGSSGDSDDDDDDDDDTSSLIDDGGHVMSSSDQTPADALWTRRRFSATASNFDSADFIWQVDKSDVVVLDTGSHTVKAGIASDRFPRVVTRSYDIVSGAPLVDRQHIGATMDPTVSGTSS
jgi:hypothetical protein